MLLHPPPPSPHFFSGGPQWREEQTFPSVQFIIQALMNVLSEKKGSCKSPSGARRTATGVDTGSSSASGSPHRSPSSSPRRHSHNHHHHRSPTTVDRHGSPRHTSHGLVDTDVGRSTGGSLPSPSASSAAAGVTSSPRLQAKGDGELALQKSPKQSKTSPSRGDGKLSLIPTRTPMLVLILMLKILLLLLILLILQRLLTALQ